LKTVDNIGSKPLIFNGFFICLNGFPQDFPKWLARIFCRMTWGWEVWLRTVALVKASQAAHQLKQLDMKNSASSLSIRTG